MSDKHVKFFKAALVEELRNTLAGRVFTFGVLLVDRFLTTAKTGFCPLVDELLDLCLLCAHIYLLKSCLISYIVFG